ncbi:hypothetical protein [Candidatus Hodgkinia cicadicola]|uniref:hypothetical protein n=1 Tax=Candidatus Hodgkinia cicadicola TaxID=573658 RepID=UPI001788B4CF
MVVSMKLDSNLYKLLFKVNKHRSLVSWQDGMYWLLDGNSDVWLGKCRSLVCE